MSAHTRGTKKHPFTIRDFVYVTAETRGPQCHNFATNPNVGWCWTDSTKTVGGFKRCADAKRDVEKEKGNNPPVEWTEKNGVWEGRYGPRMSADEYLGRLSEKATASADES